MAEARTAQVSADTAQPRYYLRAVILTGAAAVLSFAVLVFKLSNPEESGGLLAPLASYAALGVFLLIAPALHIASLVSAVQGLRRGDGLLGGIASQLLNLLVLGLDFLVGAAALIGASA